MKRLNLTRLFSSFVALFLGLLVFANECGAATGSEGKEFYFAFQPNYDGSDYLEVIISGETATSGTIEVPGVNFRQPFTVEANKAITIVLPREAYLNSAEIASNVTVHVVAQKGITVYGMNRRGGTTDGFLALPVDALGTEYFALSYKGAYPSQLTLIGAFDGTAVTVTPTISFYNRPVGIPFVVKLNRGQSYMLQGYGDLSGTRVVGSAPIAVMAGANAANIPAAYPFLDHIVEMMPPLSTWGRSFLTVPLATRLRGDLFRILAAEDGTGVLLNGTLVSTLARGQFYETMLAERSQITASAPVLVSQFATGTSYDGVDGDPFAMIIPPSEQFLDHYTFSLPNDVSYPRQFVNVVIPSGEIASLTLDGAPAPCANMT